MMISAPTAEAVSIPRLAVPPRACPACSRRVARTWGHHGGFTLLCCDRCHTVYTSSLPARIVSEDYDRFYNEDHLSGHTPPFVADRLDEIVAGFAPYRGGGRLLDVGFGAGMLLSAAARAGFRAEGVELSRSAVERVRKQGFKARCGDLCQMDYPASSMDVVTATELVEHLPDPRLIAAEVARVLRPGGLFWATTPNGQGLSGRLLGSRWSAAGPPEHLQLFSPKGISMLLLSVGFRQVRVQCHGTNPFEVVHQLLLPLRGPAAPQGFGRVQSSYQLNGFLVKSPLRRALKQAANAVLDAGGLGDSLKIWAER